MKPGANREAPFLVLSLCLVAGLSAACCKASGCNPAGSSRQRIEGSGATDSSGAQAPPSAESAAPVLLPPREEGPPRPEEQQSIQAAGAEAEALARSLLAGGISRREVASIADMRGYRLFRKRRYAQAHAWFIRATQVDGTFELSLFNAARCAALLDRGPEAHALLHRLRALKTPLSRSLARRADRDPDLAAAPVR